jgi:hypothetical protein
MPASRRLRRMNHNNLFIIAGVFQYNGKRLKRSRQESIHVSTKKSLGFVAGSTVMIVDREFR